MDATKTLTLQAVDNDWLLDFDKKGYKMESDVIPSYLLHDAIRFLIKNFNGTRNFDGNMCKDLDASYANFKIQQNVDDKLFNSYLREELHSKEFYNIIFAPRLLTRLRSLLKTKSLTLYPVYMLRTQEIGEKNS